MYLRKLISYKTDVLRKFKDDYRLQDYTVTTHGGRYSARALLFEPKNKEELQHFFKELHGLNQHIPKKFRVLPIGAEQSIGCQSVPISGADSFALNSIVIRLSDKPFGQIEQKKLFSSASRCRSHLFKTV